MIHLEVYSKYQLSLLYGNRLKELVAVQLDWLRWVKTVNSTNPQSHRARVGFTVPGNHQVLWLPGKMSIPQPVVNCCWQLMAKATIM